MSYLQRYLPMCPMVLVILFLLMLSGCGRMYPDTSGPIVCTTTYGLQIIGPVPPMDSKYVGTRGWECDDVDRVETEIVLAFRDMVTEDNRFFGETWTGWEGYRVRVRPTIEWMDPQLHQDETLYGETWCDSHYIEVNDAPPQAGTLAHELAHAIQNCDPKGPKDKKDPYHSNWNSEGIYNAIDYVYSEWNVKYWGNPQCWNGATYAGPADGSPCY